MQVFRTTRERLKWSQYKLAKSLEISQTRLKHLEEKAADCHIRLVVRLAEIWQRERLGTAKAFLRELSKDVQ